MTARLSSLADFRRLWLVGLVICVVRWLETLAFGLFAYQVTGSAFVVAMLTMLRLLPMGLFGAFLGAAAERFERRRALILVVATSMAVTLVLAVLASLGAIQVWHLALASFINGIGWASD
ncbi:MAG: MFS transporter, partial [Burkholderiales bacterium]